MIVAFKKAERRQAFLRLALTGPSGSGKTYSALRIASGMGKKIAVMDTENRSASLYAGGFDFETEEIDPPYTVDRYIEAIDEAVKRGFEILIIDSLTHVWKGQGGLLEQKEALDSRARSNSFANWASITKLHNKLISKLLTADIHLICNMRSKQDYILVDKDGKQVPKKVGMAPEQREGLEYEFTVVLDLAMDHSAEASKDRTGLFDKKLFVPSEDTGKDLMKWLQTGEPVVIPQRPVASANPPPQKEKPGSWKPSDAQLRRLYAIAHSHGWDDESARSYIQIQYGVDSSKDIDVKQYEEVCKYFESNPKAS
jgi:hypothetical protein